MKRLLILPVLLVFALSLGCHSQSQDKSNNNVSMTASDPAAPQKDELSKSIYDYSFTSLDGKTVKISDFKGKKILFVNTASQCGYTPQYEQLEKVSKQLKGKLVIIGFPTNDFGQQEPGNNGEIAEFCKKNYGVTFPMSQKITVKGDSMAPIYKWLTRKDLNGKLDSEIKWNFQKYLVDEKGNLMSMYYSKIKPDDAQIVDEIKK